jgi:hypothetical protein
MHQKTKGWHYQGILSGVADGVAVLACIALTRHETVYWQDEVSLWRRAVAVTENNYDAHYRLGNALPVPAVNAQSAAFASALAARMNARTLA